MAKKTLTISLKKWLRAGGKGGVWDAPTTSYWEYESSVPEGLAAVSSLLSKVNGRMCCLGFACKAAGVKKQTEVGMPEDLSLPDRRRAKKAFPWLFDAVDCNSYDARELAAVNDDVGLTNTERKRKVIALFKANGVKVKFVP